jgi:1-acyl-sn-glycerol-3-phosphate acyltransferase
VRRPQELLGRRWTKRGINRILYLFTKYLSGLVLTLFFQIKEEGIEHLPKEKAFILLPKHQRWWDIPLIGWVTPWPLYYMAKYELFLNPLIGWYLSTIGGIPINRANLLSSRRSLIQMLEHLGSGNGIVIFPEGTYYRNQVGQLRPGLIKMVRARLNKVSFIPVGIRYTERKGRKQVKIKFGKPMEQDSGLNTEVFLEKVMKEIAILSEL